MSPDHAIAVWHDAMHGDALARELIEDMCEIKIVSSDAGFGFLEWTVIGVRRRIAFSYAATLQASGDQIHEMPVVTKSHDYNWLRARPLKIKMEMALAGAWWSASSASSKIKCHRCERHGRISLARLIDEHGADVGPPDLWESLAGDCQHARSTGLNNRCAIYYPQLPVLFLPTKEP
jgi:hypothetical protein